MALLDELAAAGAWMQITVDSVLGNHGAMPAAMGKALLESYPAAVLSTDAHNLVRCSGLRAGFDWIRENLGSDRAERFIATGCAC